MLVMARIGLDKPEPQYLETLLKIMDCRHFFAVLGGTPRYAHLFLKHRQGYLGMLDPHETKKAAESEEDLLNKLGEYSGRLEWVKKEKISSSMCIMFAMKGTEVDAFWEEMLEVKKKCGDDFFLYMAEERPVYDEGDLIEILEIE